MSAHRGLRQAEMRNKVPDLVLTEGKVLQDGETGRLAERLEQVRVDPVGVIAERVGRYLIDRHRAMISL